MAVERYHHGNLRSALLDAAVDMSRDTGAEALSLRAVTRRVGVSTRAAYRHFASRQDLIRAVAIVGLSRMAVMIEAELDGMTSPVQRLCAVGRGYIGFALTEPGWFDVAMLTSRGFDLFAEEGAKGDSGLTPHGLLLAALDDLVSDGLIEPGDVERTATLCWSSVHGYSSLVSRGPLSTISDGAARAVGGMLATDIVHSIVLGGVTAARGDLGLKVDPLVRPSGRARGSRGR
ncbi:MAG: TetR/AcrR family transcriptional regulator [Phycicoccus sp.]